MPVDRTWYNALVDSDGSPGSGTVWDKAAVDALLDVVDVALVDVIAGVSVSSTHQVYFMGHSMVFEGTFPKRVGVLLGTSWDVVNKGINGETTTQQLARFAADVTAHTDCEYVVIFAGINDVLLDVSAAAIEANLQAMYTAAAAANIRVVAVTITPFKTQAQWTAPRQAVLDAVNAWILATAINVDYRVDAYSALEDPGAADTLLAAYDSGDHLHLSSAGYIVLGTTVHAGATWTPRADFNLGKSLVVTGALKGETIEPTGLATGYLPYKSLTSLDVSPLWTDRTSIGLGTVAPGSLLHVVGGAVNVGATAVATIAGDIGVSRDATSGAVFLGADGQAYVYRTGGVLNITAKAGESISISNNPLYVSTDATTGAVFLGSDTLSYVYRTGGVLNITTKTGDSISLLGGPVLVPASVSTPALISAAALAVTPAAGSSLSVVLSGAGDLIVNTNQLVVDTSTARVGINTATPGAALDVQGGAIISGYLAVGASAGLASGDISASRSATTGIVALGSDAGLYFYRSGATALEMQGVASLKLTGYTATTFVAGDKYLVVDASGNLHVSALGPAS